MASTSILGVIQHYQRSIEHSQGDESRLLHCINKLYKLPVKVEHLQETGVGKTVNSLRKYNGEIGIAAKALVTKWKAMVTAEEEPAEVMNCNANDDDDMNNTNGHGSSDDDRHNHSEKKNSPQEHTHSNTLNESTSKDHQNKHRDKSSSEHKSKSHSESKTHKHEHSTTKRKRDVEHDEKELSLVKKSKHEDRRSEEKNRENDRHKSSEEKSTRYREKQCSNRDAKTTSSSTTHHKNGGDFKEKKESLKGEKSSEQSSSTKRQTNSSSEKSNKHGESEKHRSSKDKDRHDKSKSSSKYTSHRDKHHKPSTSHSSSSKPTRSTNEQAAPSSSDTKDESKNSSSKRQQDSDSNDSTSTKDKVSKTPKDNKQKDESKNSSSKRQQDSDSNDSTSTKAKVSKTPKDNKQKDTTNDNEDEVDAGDGIDSSMGANFADVLGMLNIPTKKSKKSLSTNKSPTVSTSSRSTSNEKASSSSSSTKTAKIEYKPSPISSASTSAKPDLLSASASAKLAPLDPSIALELPTISANYKPLPHNKTVMDCIYRNSGGILSTPKPVRTLTDAEALSHGISSKTMRTKIYSGIKTGQILQVPSLFDLSTRVLQKNIDGLEYTGGVPFDVLRPVLDRATPQQLLTFEEYNPYVMEDSDCLWQIHVQRNYRNKKRMEMESWREMFLRCEEEKEQKLNILTETIKQSQKVIAAPVRKTQLAFVDSMVKPPRNVMRKQEQFGTKAKLVATPAARVAALSNVTPNAGKVGDTRLRVAATVRDAAQAHAPMRAKKAPLMAKTLQFMRGRHRR